MGSFFTLKYPCSLYCRKLFSSPNLFFLIYKRTCPSRNLLPLIYHFNIQQNRKFKLTFFPIPTVGRLDRTPRWHAKPKPKHALAFLSLERTKNKE